MEDREQSDWAQLPAAIRAAISVAWRDGMPPAASALYGRWWQFETWLRSLVYVELRAAFGAEWISQLPGHSEKRRQGDEAFRYMATPDAQAVLAYTDASGLFEIIEAHWSLFEGALLERAVWSGRTVELRNIRNRIGHCRRPHSDDLARLEQTLRDLEGGAFRAAAAFNRQFRTGPEWKDPVVEAWIQGTHETAQRLIQHAQRQYETSFDLNWSFRPWINHVSANGPVEGKAGYIWHAHWHMRARGLNLRRFWEDDQLDPWRDSILFLCATGPGAFEVSFAALEDPRAIADTIGACFDLALYHQARGDLPEDVYKRWGALHADMDPRVQTHSAWSIVDDSTKPISIFGA